VEEKPKNQGVGKNRKNTTAERKKASQRGQIQKWW